MYKEGLGGIACYIYFKFQNTIICSCTFLYYYNTFISSTKKKYYFPLDAMLLLLLNIIAFNLHIQINETTSPQRIVNNVDAAVVVCCMYPVNMLVVVECIMICNVASIIKEFDSNSSVVYDIFHFAISRAFWRICFGINCFPVNHIIKIFCLFS